MRSFTGGARRRAARDAPQPQQMTCGAHQRVTPHVSEIRPNPRSERNREGAVTIIATGERDWIRRTRSSNGSTGRPESHQGKRLDDQEAQIAENAQVSSGLIFLDAMFCLFLLSVCRLMRCLVFYRCVSAHI